MTGFPGSPRLVKGGIVLIDPDTAAVQRVIALQYNPDTLTPHAAGQGGGRRQPGPLRGAAAQGPAGRDDQARRRDRRDRPARVPGPEPERGAGRHLPAARGAGDDRLSDERAAHREQRARGGRARSRSCRWRRRSALFVWSKNRVVPVRITEFSITEEAFDPALNPIRAKVSLGDARAHRRRPRLRPQGRQPVHDLPAGEGAARGEEHRPRSARSGSEGFRERPAAAASRPGRPQGDAVSDQQPLPRRRHGHAPGAGRPDDRLPAAPLRAAAGALRAAAGAHRDRRATGSTTSPRATSAIRSSSGASATPTARSAPGGADREAGPAAADHAAGRHPGSRPNA